MVYISLGEFRLGRAVEVSDRCKREWSNDGPPYFPQTEIDTRDRTSGEIRHEHLDATLKYLHRAVQADPFDYTNRTQRMLMAVKVRTVARDPLGFGQASHATELADGLVDTVCFRWLLEETVDCKQAMQNIKLTGSKLARSRNAGGLLPVGAAEARSYPSCNGADSCLAPTLTPVESSVPPR